ncbi:hypothetical protein T440DRAFT_388156 [Plenodomus tracheiphilus IPT5]|uniref:Uncharacterized protein n=1 Tax=Plenodomus tracheiphilus IPT5 TaxID=1408161 RepID=A0A6A7BFV0_9PLEO|nr:hypothetical protein T440DRAFT_388156 [Plenodomus tracheiphilus IPT5]
MPYSGSPNTPRGDPLAGWKQQNLAAPKSAAQQDYHYQTTVYDDRPPVPIEAPDPTPSPPTLPHALASPSPPSTRDHDAEEGACPDGDTRWPPPKTSHSKPLQLLLDVKGSQRIYYHLIHKNTAPESKFWKKEIQLKSQSFFTQKFPSAEEQLTTSGESPQKIQEAKEQAEFEEKGRMRSAIITAKLQKKMRELSTGVRGTIRLLEEESVEVWKCIELLQKGDSNKAVRIGAVVEKFEIFGVGLKGEKDHVLLVSQRMG